MILKHLPEEQWPLADRLAFEAAFRPGDLFDEAAGAGAHLAAGSRKSILNGYRRWLGFLSMRHPDDLHRPPADRLTRDRVRDYLGDLSKTMRPSSVATTLQCLYYGARLLAPGQDWRWLSDVRGSLFAKAQSRNRFERLVPPTQTLDYGIEVMDAALTLPARGAKTRELQYRDGLLIALVSLWPIRRRSLAALTVTHHVEIVGDEINFLLHAEDTKADRPESFAAPRPLVPYLKTWLREIRPRLIGRRAHDGFWASYRSERLTGGRLYDIARARLRTRFGKDMSLHDFRRAAATYLAMDAPEQVGLIPGLLQHASTEVGEKHYNLANAISASQRFARQRAATKKRLKPLTGRRTCG